MRRPLLLTLIIAAHPSLAVAQRFSFGFKAGVSAAHQADLQIQSPRQGTVPRWAGMVGLHAAKNVISELGLLGEVYYVARSYWAPGYSLNLGYLEAPVLVRAVVPLHSRIRPLLVAGASGALKVGCWEDDRGVLYDRIKYVEGVQCPGPKTSRWDAGLVFGGGVEAGTRRTRLTAELRYTHGLVNFYASETGFRAYNRALAFIFGVARVR